MASSNLIWVCSQASAARGMRIHPCSDVLLYWIQGMFSLTTMWLWGIFFTESNHGASIFLVPLRFLRKQHLSFWMCMLWRVPTGEPIANPIEWKTYLYMGLAISIILGYWTCLYLLHPWVRYLSPFGGCHGLLLGYGINNINHMQSWSYHGSPLLASAYPCVNRAYRSSLVCRHWHGHPGLVTVLHRVLYSINPFQYVDLISGLSSCENQHLVADCWALFII
jgi:hypothetical protein